MSSTPKSVLVAACVLLGEKKGQLLINFWFFCYTLLICIYIYIYKFKSRANQLMKKKNLILIELNA